MMLVQVEYPRLNIRKNTLSVICPYTGFAEKNPAWYPVHPCSLVDVLEEEGEEDEEAYEFRVADSYKGDPDTDPMNKLNPDLTFKKKPESPFNKRPVST